MAINGHQLLLVDIEYSDQEGGQRTTSRFALAYLNDHWLPSVARHWRLDGRDPR